MSMHIFPARAYALDIDEYKKNIGKLNDFRNYLNLFPLIIS